MMQQQCHAAVTLAVATITVVTCLLLIVSGRVVFWHDSRWITLHYVQNL